MVARPSHGLGSLRGGRSTLVYRLLQVDQNTPQKVCIDILLNLLVVQL
jgi:hypothetical protein